MEDQDNYFRFRTSYNRNKKGIVQFNSAMLTETKEPMNKQWHEIWPKYRDIIYLLSKAA